MSSVSGGPAAGASMPPQQSNMILRVTQAWHPVRTTCIQNSLGSSSTVSGSKAWQTQEVVG